MLSRKLGTKHVSHKLAMLAGLALLASSASIQWQNSHAIEQDSANAASNDTALVELAEADATNQNGSGNLLLDLGLLMLSW